MGGETWNASDHPRFEFAASPVLYKLYVAYPLDRSRTIVLRQTRDELSLLSTYQIQERSIQSRSFRCR